MYLKWPNVQTTAATWGNAKRPDVRSYGRTPTALSTGSLPVQVSSCGTTARMDSIGDTEGAGRRKRRSHYCSTGPKIRKPHKSTIKILSWL